MSADDQTPLTNELMVSGTASMQRDAEPDAIQTLVPTGKGGITPLPLTETLKDIRQINTQAAMLLLCSHASRLETDLQDVKIERVEAQKKSEEWMKAYYDEAKKSAVLNSELSAVTSKKNLQKFVGSIGGVIAGVAIPFILTEPTRGWGIAGSLVGVTLLVAGFWPTRLSQTIK